MKARGRAPAGLCGSCRHARRIESDRGSLFLLCRRSRTDARYPRYPRLPVRRCAGYQPVEEARDPEEGVEEGRPVEEGNPGSEATR